MFRLLSARPGLFAERTSHLPAEVEGKIGVSYTPAFGIRFDEEERRLDIGVFVTARLAPLDGEPDQDEDPAAETEVTCVYEFRDLEPFRVDGRVQIPRPLLAHLVGMTLSTARGVMVARTRHTVFQQAPLPISSPIAFIDELVEGDEFDWVAPGVQPPPE